MARRVLTSEEIELSLKALDGWRIEDGKLHREYRFGDFATAFAFMAASAAWAERMDHHPEWCNVYGRVTVDLATHDAGGITERDFELATAMERIAGRLL